MLLLTTDADALNEVIPGVTDAFDALRATNNDGIYTSNGAYYNHTVFGRDAALSGRFVCDFDHDLARDIIIRLARLQGYKYRQRNQEEPGRIHHEWRDFRTWKGRPMERLSVAFAGLLWGAHDHRLLTYYASDSTAEYIRLVEKYARRVDRSLLEATYVAKNGRTLTVLDSLVDAANWLVGKVDDHGRFMTTRSHFSLPYQTLQDSVTAYAWSDGRPVNFHRPHSFLNTQAAGADALEQLSKLLAGQHPSARRYQDTAHAMRRALLNDYWDMSQQTFTSVLSERRGVLQQLDVPNISAGWTLNASWWSEVPHNDRVQRIAAIVNRLFSDEFLTEAGLRMRSKYIREPLGDLVDYHGAQTVWPITTFLVAEGLRQHNMFRLADQLEWRVINGINAIGKFAEFMVVDKKGQLLHPTNDPTLPRLSAQMIPERDIAFTIVPLITMAQRVDERRTEVLEDWQHDLECAILSRIPLVSLLSPEEARRELQPPRIYLTRAGATFRSVVHIMRKGV